MVLSSYRAHVLATSLIMSSIIDTSFRFCGFSPGTAHLKTKHSSRELSFVARSVRSYSSSLSLQILCILCIIFNWIKYRIETNWIICIFIFLTWINCDSTKCWNSLFTCFTFCRRLSSISIKSNSGLKRIKSDAFSSSSLQSIVTPRCVQFIDGSALERAKLTSILIEAWNNFFHVEHGPSQIDSEFCSFMRYWHSSNDWNYRFIMFFIMWETLINFIGIKFRIETDRGSDTQWHVCALSRDSFNHLFHCVDCIRPSLSDLTSWWQFLSWVGTRISGSSGR
jgi:hypothetical protein